MLRFEQHGNNKFIGGYTEARATARPFKIASPETFSEILIRREK